MSKVNFTQCYGCGVCAVACPQHAIQIKHNEDGFFRPYVDNSCVNCGVCLKVCAFNSEAHIKASDSIPPVSVGAWSTDDDVRNRCTSGGVTYEIERFLLTQGYHVVGVKYNMIDHIAEHYIATNESELEASIGSKYIQSYTVDGFRELSNGERYVVVGTPCQIDSLRRFARLKKVEDNIVFIDFFCHSVPSIKMWRKYLEYVGFKHFDHIQFRSKIDGWQNSTTTYIKGDGKEWISALRNKDLFYWFFLGDRCLNPACAYQCKYKMQNSSADIRVGDLWGKKYMKDVKGVSALVAFTQKGKDVLGQLNSCIKEPCDFATVSEHQMKSNAKPKRSYKYVLKALREGKSLKTIYRRACYIELPDTLKNKSVYYFKRVLEKSGLKKSR